MRLPFALLALASVCLTHAQTPPIAPIQAAAAQTLPTEFEADRKPSFATGGNVLIKNGHILTITKGVVEGDVLVLNGKISKVGPNLTAPAGVKVIDATGKFVTPGLVDAHSHRGADDINEGADSITAEVRIEDVLNPNQDSLYHALASGITTGMLLHGSANAIGGQSLVIKHKFMHPPSEVVFPGAPRMIKFALGENPTRPGGQSTPRYPASRMGMETVYRRAFEDAKEYSRQWQDYEAHRSDPKVAPPRRDLRLETLADILNGKIHVQCHSYRQDEILMMVRLSQEFKFSLTLQHALESYKLAPILAAAHIPVSIFGDGFAYKLEVVDSTPMASTILDKAGVLVSVNTDTGGGTVPLTQDAAKAIRYGTSPERALRMITINPAIELGIQSKVGSIEEGKDGDLAIWDGHPLSVYTKCTMSLIEGEVYFERKDKFKVDGRSMAAKAPDGHPFDINGNKLPPVAKSYLIAGATVHPISGPELPKADVLIADGKIVAIGANLKVPAGSSQIDGKGLHVWPGMIDAGSQLGLAEIGQVNSATDTNENGDYVPDLRAITAINPDSVHFPKARYNGITSAVVFPSAGIMSGRSGLVKTLGSTNEGMTIESEVGLNVSVPDSPPARFKEFYPPGEFDKQVAAVKGRKRALREYFEAGQRYAALHDADLSAPIDLKMEALRPYLARKKPVIFQCTTEESIRYAIALAEAVKVRPILFGAGDAWKLAKFLKEKGIPIIASPPGVACPDEDDPSEFDPYDTPQAFGSVLQDAGLSFAFASSRWDMAMDLPYRVGRMCAYGLSHDAAMRALTLDAAKILGVDDRLGSLEAGKIANVIVTDGDPLEVTSHVRYLFIDGKPLPLESHYTDLWRRYYH